MSDKENNIIYTAKDIEQYLAGNMTAQQMHTLEKAALDDPFLAEAIEGYETANGQDWNKQLIALREEIAGKGSVAKVIPLHKPKNNWWKAAAAVFIIGSAVTLAFIFNNKNKTADSGKTEIAQVTPAIKDTASPTETAAITSVTQSLNPSASESKEEKKAIPGTIAQVDKINKDDIAPAPVNGGLPPAAPVTSGKATDNEIAVVPPPAVADDNSNAAKEITAEKSKAAAKQSSEADVLARQKNIPPASAKKEAVLNNFFSAQVVSTDNTPLPFTNISIKKENFGTYADAKGIVRLVSTDSILNIEVKSVGYQAKTFALRNNQLQTKIVLQEEEVAVKDRKVIGKADMSAGTRSRRATLIKDSVVNVEPADGWENYNTYVANNLDIPESGLNNDRHGEVEISFDVKANGTISNIRVNKSLGAEYDEAAKRLIKDGPQWKVKKGKKTSASVRVQF